MFARHTIAWAHLFQCAGVFLAMQLSYSAFACQYNVRDVGFVDLGGSDYVLTLSWGSEVADARRTEFERAIEEFFLETNVVVKAQEADGSDTKATLIAPDGRSIGVGVPDLSNADEVEAALSSLLMSPGRERIIDAAMEHYAVILVVNGPDEFDNEQALGAAEGAELHIQSQMMLLPKPIANPPATMVMTQEEAAEEEVFLWSLGMEDLSETQVVVLYGRGRLLGAPLRGAEIEEETLKIFLTIIGSDCECGLDRQWMQGTMIPARWDSETLGRLAQDLGFDTENPLVKAEMSSVLGKNAGANRATGADEATDAFSKLAMGYSETAVVFDEEQADTPEASAETVETEAETSATRPAMNRMYMTMGAIALVVVAGSAFVLLSRKRQD